jgi:hypothetical protein
LCPPVDEDYSDCSKGSPEYYANRIATGQGSRALNEIGGVLSTLARTASDHVQVSGTVGFKTVQMDSHALVSGGASGSISTQTSMAFGPVPMLGASADVVIGNPNPGAEDSFISVGVSRHLGITVTFDASNGGKPKSITFNLGLSTPVPIPVMAGGSTKVIQE